MKNHIIYKKSNIVYTDISIGNSVVLLHGFLGNMSMWNYISSNLSKQNRVICIDLPGHGNSDSIAKIHTMKEMALAVEAVLTFLNINQFYIIGHSMGGYVALAILEKYPKKIKGICLLNSTAEADTEQRKKLRLRACRMAETNYKNLVKISISNLFSTQINNKFSAEIADMKKQALQISVQAYIAATQGMCQRENKEAVLQSVAKRLIIAGKQDSLLNFQDIREQAKRTNTPLHELNGGHMSHIENKKALLEILYKFINN